MIDRQDFAKTIDLKDDFQTQHSYVVYRQPESEDETCQILQQLDKDQDTQQYDSSQNEHVQLTGMLTTMLQNLSEKKSIQMENKYTVINIDHYKNLQFIVSKEQDYFKGAYSKIDVVENNKMKLVRKKVHDQKAFENELRFFLNYKDQYIVNIFYYSQYEQQFYLELGDYTIQSLFKTKKIQNQFFILILCLSIIEGVQSLHCQNIYHGDIKPQNIILFKKPGYDDQKIQENNQIDLHLVEQFFNIDSSVQFNLCEHSQQNSQKRLNKQVKYSDFIRVIQQQNLKQQQNNCQKRNPQQKLKYTNILEDYFKLSIKFIDFQSFVNLNESSKSIKFYTHSFSNQNLLTKLKSNPRGLNQLEKIQFDYYCTFRTMILISQNINIDQNFMTFQDEKSIQNVDNYLLQSFLTQFYKVFDNINSEKHEITQLPTQKFQCKICKCQT